MAAPRIRLNHSEMGKLLKSDQMRPPLRTEAVKAATRAQMSAPVDTSEYRNGIVVRPDTTDRAVERVVATAPHSLIVEARTGNLKRALGPR
jgi:hypothetical protein